MTSKTLKTLTFLGALAVAGSLQATELAVPAGASLDPCVNGAVSASGRFPTQAMEDQFDRYLNWVAENGLAVKHAVAPRIDTTRSLEPALNGEVSATGRFPTQAMEDQYRAYVAWVKEQGISKTHAFQGVAGVEAEVVR